MLMPVIIAAFCVLEADPHDAVQRMLPRRVWMVVFVVRIAALGSDVERGSVRHEIRRDLCGAEIALGILDGNIIQPAYPGLGCGHAAVNVVPDGEYRREFSIGSTPVSRWRILDLVLSSAGKEVVGGHGYKNHPFLDTVWCWYLFDKFGGRLTEQYILNAEP